MTFFFVPALLLSIHTPLLLPSSSVFLILFPSCCFHAQCVGKHSSISSPFPIALLNGTAFSNTATTSAQCVFGAKN